MTKAKPVNHTVKGNYVKIIYLFHNFKLLTSFSNKKFLTTNEFQVEMSHTLLAKLLARIILSFAIKLVP